MDNTKTIDQLIDEASKDSFPASDAPVWTTGLEQRRFKSESEKHINAKESDKPWGNPQQMSPAQANSLIDDIPEAKYGNSTFEEDQHPQRNLGVKQTGLAKKLS